MNDKIKMFAALGLAAIVGLTASVKFATAERRGDFYPETGVVCEVSRGTDIVVVKTSTGNIFSFYGAEDWMVGDVASLLMDNRATEEVKDDEVVTAHYAGWNFGGED